MYKLIKSSGSGSTKQIDTIHFEIVSPKTLASYIMLSDSLRKQDVDFLDKYSEVFKRIEFSRNYLTKKQIECGTLTCVYCQKSELVIELDGMRVNHNIMATIDHVVPISKGGGIYDLENIVVACGKCNTNKSNKNVEDFIKK